jgi:hypothetical protein
MSVSNVTKFRPTDVSVDHLAYLFRNRHAQHHSVYISENNLQNYQYQLYPPLRGSQSFVEIWSTIHVNLGPFHDCSPPVPILCLSSPISNAHYLYIFLDWIQPSDSRSTYSSRVNFLQGLCSCIPNRCPSHLNLPDLITFIISCSLYS